MSLKFSIITATFNSEKSIADSIESVKKQSFENYELLFIDGASTDKTVEVIEAKTVDVANKVKIISEPDKGIYDALNKGVALASGDVVCFLHADDFYASNDVLAEVNKAFETSSVEGVYGDLVYVSKEDTQKTIRYWQSGNCSKKKLTQGWMPPHPSFFVKRSVYEKFGNFDLNLKIAADYDFMMRVLFREQISVKYISKILVKMRVGGASNKSLKNIIQKSREDLIAMKKNGLGGFYSLVIKNIRKIPQFIFRAS